MKTKNDNYSESEQPYSDDDVVGLCACTDGAMAPMLIVKTPNKKFTLYGISKIYGFGIGDWNKKIIDDEFDEIRPYNTFNGTSHIALRKNNKWGLIELRDNDTVECELKILTENKYEELDKLLKMYDVKEE